MVFYPRSRFKHDCPISTPMLPVRDDAGAALADRSSRRGSGSVSGRTPPFMSASLAPCTVKAAIKQVKAWHRHLPELQGGLFAVRVNMQDSVFDGTWHCVGVGVAGNPSRVWQDTGRIVITRVATAGAENACSMIYGALARAAKALGYREVWTYTLPDEPGTSLRAAGFMDMGMTGGGEWDRPSRARKAAVKPEPKRRWMRKLAA